METKRYPLTEEIDGVDGYVEIYKGRQKFVMEDGKKVAPSALVYHMVVSRDAVNNEFIENYAFDPFHPDRDLQDAYYEAAHRGGCYAKNVYANKASKYMNIDITRGLKEIDNSLYIVEGEAENNGEAIVEAYKNVNPSVEAVTLKETKHFPHVEAPEQFLEQVGIFF